MSVESKTREELLKDLHELQDRLSRLEQGQSERSPEVSPGAGSPFPPMYLRDSFQELREPPRPLRLYDEGTESIELKTILSKDITNSGSFAVTGDIWATTFGKVIQALPIPAFLVDQAFRVAVANQAFRKFTKDYERIQGQPYVKLFDGPSAAERAFLLLKEVLADRSPRVGEGALRISDAMVWARLTFRAIRIIKERYVLVLVEDLTREKLQLHENEVLKEELEERVEHRTAQLKQANEDLKREVEERKRAEQEREEVIVQLREALSQVKRLSGLLPICASCKKVRDDQGYWTQIEAYIRDHSEAEFSHGICPECAKKLYPDLV